MHCLDGLWPVCSQSSSNCVLGCKQGWQGQRCGGAVCMVDNCNMCNFDNSYLCVECQYGFYRDNYATICTPCPDTCSPRTTCGGISVLCDYGCRDGITGRRCDQRCNARCAQCGQNNKVLCITCQLRFYGENCK